MKNPLHSPLLVRCAVLAGVSSACWPPASAELVWSQREVRLAATAGTDEPLEAAYGFTNTGDQPVTVTSVKPSCGCTTAALEKTTYAPGEAGAIEVLFEMEERTGEQVKQIVVRTDAPASPVTTLTLRVDITEPVRLSPQLLLWAAGEPRGPKQLTLIAAAGHRIATPEVAGDTGSVVVEILPDAEAPAGGEGVEDASAIPAETEPAGLHDASAKPQRFRVQVTPPGDGGGHRALVRLRLTGERGEELPERKFLVRVLPDPPASERAPGDAGVGG